MKKRKNNKQYCGSMFVKEMSQVADAASDGSKVHFNTEDNDTDLTLLQSITTEEVTL